MKQDEIDARLSRLAAEVHRQAARRPVFTEANAGGHKSILASALLSFFFGPIGWLYAGSFREAVPAALVYFLVCAVLPRFLLAYLLGPVCAISAVAGVLYAWAYNRSGRRSMLILRDRPALPR